MKYLRLGIVILLLLGCITSNAKNVKQDNPNQSKPDQNKSCDHQNSLTFKISLAKEFANETLSGRLIVLMSSRLARNGELIPFFGRYSRLVWISAKEITHLNASSSITINPVKDVFPSAFCEAPEADYYFKAILDVDHDYAYNPAVSSGDWYSETQQAFIDPSSVGTLELVLSHIKTEPAVELPPQTEIFELVSPSVSQFLTHETSIKSLVLLPPNYVKGKKNYPTVFSFHGFGTDLRYLIDNEVNPLLQGMKSGKIPPMIWVFPLMKTPLGTHVFTDSVNNGPWGTALVEELIPALEQKYRMDSNPNGRFTTGHSSGAWASLWLQTNYPDLFGGSWSVAPDPVDFRNFVRIDLSQRPTQNFYYEADGTPRIAIRMDGAQGQSMLDLVKQELVFGDYGGQTTTFESVFSPRSSDGRPMRLFDRDSGVIDATVADYWIKNYDISQRLANSAKPIKHIDNPSIHIIVGTRDNLYLNESVQLMKNRVNSFGGSIEYQFVEGKDHWSILQDDLLEKIANQMYRIARDI